MRLRHLHLDAYGLFTDRKLDLGESAAHDIVIVAGHNESGKSTMRNAIVEAFYGIDNRTKLDFLHDKKDMRIGATIEHEGQSLTFTQFKRKKDPVQDASGMILSPGELGTLLGPMTRPEYERMYSLSQTALREGGKQMLDPASTTGQTLFQSAAGLTAFRSVLTALDAEAHAIQSRAATATFSIAAEKLDVAKRRLTLAKLTKSAWSKLRVEYDRAQEQDLEARKVEQQAQAQLSRVERITTLAPQVAAYREALRASEEHKATVDLPVDALTTLTQARATLENLKQQIVTQTRERDQLTLQREALPARDAVLDDAQDIRSQDRESPRVSDARRDLPGDLTRYNGHKIQAQAAMAALGWPGEIPLETAQDVQAAIRKLPLAPDLAQIKARITEFQKLSTSFKQLEETCEDLESARVQKALACEQAPRPEPLDALDAAVADAKRFINRSSTASDDLAKEKVALAEQTRKLRWTATSEELGQVAVPDETARSALRLVLKTASDQLDKARTLRQRDLESLESTHTSRDKALDSGEPVTDEQIAEIRAQRDHHWHHIQHQPEELAKVAGVFTQRIAEADVLSDRRYLHAEISAALQAAEAACERAEEKLRHADAALCTAEEQSAQAARNFQTALSSAGIPPMEFESLAAWITDRETALATASRCTVAQGRVERDAQAERDLIQALVAALGADSPGTAPTLAQALAAGERIQACAQQQATAANSAVQALDLATQHLAGATTKRGNQRKACEKASADLAAIFRRIGVAHDGDVDRAQSMVTQMSQLTTTLDQMLTLRSERIDPRITLLETHQKLVHRLAERHLLGRALGEGQHLPALVAHLDQAEQTEARRTSLNVSISAHDKRIEQLQQDQQEQFNKLASLYSLAGSEDLDEVLRLAQRSDGARRAREEVAKLVDVLVKSGKGLPLAVLLDEDEQIPVDDRSAQLLAAQQAAHVARETSDSSLKAFQEADKSLNAAGSTDEAAQADADRVASLALYVQGADRLIAIRTQQELLARALAIYCESAQGPLLNLASEYFCLLTNHEYDRLLIPDPDAPKLVARKKDGRTTDSGWSEGTEDQLYLALRLAAIEQKVDLGHPMPLLADDLFVNFDNQRSRAGFEALRKISTKMQVIYFTHHHHLLEIAKLALGNDVRIVDLG